MSKRERRTFSKEFKAQAVELVLTSGQSVGKTAKDLDLTESALDRWVKQAKGAVKGARSGTPRDDHAELARLREENRILRMERDFLKKAAAFFAKESK